MESLFRKIFLLPILALGILTLENCCYDDNCCYDGDCYQQKEWGLRPEYSNDLDDIVQLEEPRSIRNPGKIYSYQNYLLVNEVQKGMHIIDNIDPRNPIPIYFLKIAGSNDIAIKNDILYADQFDHLISIRLDSFNEELEKKRLLNAFENYAYYDIQPDSIDVYYECPDPSLGVVVSWIADSIDYPCYTY